MYEIYPQSFSDSDGDGIGDLPGIVQRLDYLAWLGVDSLWLNPCFASPMRDAGYDVSDYLTVAPRYGTNDDLVALVNAARSVNYAFRDSSGDFRVAVASYGKVHVAAGDFDAFQLIAKGRWRAGGLHGETTLTYWYAPAARAIVKIEANDTVWGSRTSELAEYHLRP